MATAEGTPIIVEEQVDKGLKSGALGLVSSVVMGVASTAPAYSLAATLGLHRRGCRARLPDHRLPGVHPDAADLDRVQRDEQGRPGLRHDVHLGDAGVRPAHRLGGRLGHRRRGRAGHDEPGAGRLGQYMFLLFGAHGIGGEPTSGWVLLLGVGMDRRDDLHLLPRHRGVRDVPEGPAQHRSGHAATALGGRARPGRQRPSPERLDHPVSCPGSIRSRLASPRSSAESS